MVTSGCRCSLPLARGYYSANAFAAPGVYEQTDVVRGLSEKCISWWFCVGYGGAESLTTAE